MRTDRVASRRCPPLAVLLFLLAIGASLTGFGPPGLLESSDAETPVLGYQVPLAQKMVPPPVSPRAFVVVDDASGRILFGQNPHARLPMASTTKMMTALVALERGRLDQEIATTVTAADLPGSSVMGLRPGERLTLRDLLYGLLLPSGGDAAVAIARGLAGSESAFVALMNERAASLGLPDTHFVNVHGRDDPAHYSSAADLAQIARVALRDPTFAEIVATKEKTVRGRVATYDLKNTNQLLGRPDVEGVKTGLDDLAGACLVAAFRRGDARVIAVTLNSPDRFLESVTLADYTYGAFAWARARMAASPFDASPTSRAALSAGGRVAVPSWEAPLLRAEIEGGVIRYTVGSAVVWSAPISFAGEGR